MNDEAPTADDQAAAETPPPATLDRELQREVCRILALGCSLRVAADHVGCAMATIRRTARLDERFAKRLRRAATLHELRHARRVLDASKDDRHWRAAAWVLERGYPDRYASRKPAAVSPRQLSDVLGRFARLIFDSAGDATSRRRALERVEELTNQLERLKDTRRRKKKSSPTTSN